MKIITGIFIVLLFVIALMIGAENKQVVTEFFYIINTTGKDVPVPLTLLLSLAFAFGAIISGLMLFMTSLSQQMKIVSLKTQVNRLQKQLQSNNNT